MKYLYGAAVQGIQQFIFQTNKLSEITGASELVERVCTTFFDEIAKKHKRKVVVQAAGNVKCIFDNREACEDIARRFPMKVLSEVPGITISQAVVEISTNDVTQADFVELEKRLRTQRNKADRPTTLGLMGIERSRQTGLPLMASTHTDEATNAKKGLVNKTVHHLCEKAFGHDMADKNIAYYTDKMVGENNWIAIIHADGNGLGQVVQREAEKGSNALADFSKKLDEANKEAAQAAFEEIKKDFNLGDSMIPIRPIVLSGDDFTMICRGDFALDYTRSFIKNFEELTKKKGFELTACAGIAYIKSSFPFYYGYEMAESLCGAAKKDAKAMVCEQDKAPSCIMFYKIEDSFTESYSEIKERVLTTKTPDALSYSFGPYYLHECGDKRWTLQNLSEMVNEMKKEDKESNALKSHIRQWLAIRFRDASQAELKLNRMRKTLESKKNEIKKLTEITDGRVPAFDVLMQHSVQYLKTKHLNND